MNPIDIIKFIQSHFENSSEQLNALAAFADAPPEDYQPKIQLPVQNEIPAFKIGDGSFGSMLLDQNYGIPAPMFDQEDTGIPSIGQLLIGDM